MFDSVSGSPTDGCVDMSESRHCDCRARGGSGMGHRRVVTCMFGLLYYLVYHVHDSPARCRARARARARNFSHLKWCRAGEGPVWRSAAAGERVAAEIRRAGRIPAGWLQQSKITIFGECRNKAMGKIRQLSPK